MDVQFWDGKEDNRNKGLTELLNSKTYTTFNLNGDNFADLKKIKIAENEIKRIVSSRDSVKGVKFHFGPKSEYAIFIKVLDVLAIQKPDFYVPYKDDIFVANLKPRKRNKNLVSITPRICTSGSNYRREDDFINWEFLVGVLKKYYLLVILYFLMVFFQFKKIFR